ncbi:MAG: acyl carrier protein [Desulfobacterales bacterium]|nr:acyl carrier protein [Desulfobacterales bacterium]
MTRQEIQTEIYKIFQEQFEIENPGADDDLKDMHGFDSIDAIELLIEIEKMLQVNLDQETKKDAMLHIRTVNQICDYVEMLLDRYGVVNQSALNQ